MHHIIYIPGLGDHNILGQKRAVNLWRLYKVTPHVLQMNWADGQPLQEKLDRVTATIDGLSGKDKVSLVGVSAGASAVLHVFAMKTNRIHRVALICGEIKVGAHIGEAYRNNNPAFVESKDTLQHSLNQLSEQARRRIISYHPIADGTVPVSHTKLTGATSKTIPSFGHAASIGYAISLGSCGIVHWLKKSLQ